MRQLVLATHNPGKVRELRSILDGLDVVLLAGDSVELPDVEETGDTFTANALLKARSGVAATGLPCVADDSGLVVDALDGAPGIHSARWAALHDVAIGPEGPDPANVALLLEQLREVEEPDRGARFVCAAVLAMPDGRSMSVEETLEGTMTDAPRGRGGFGYDPIFQPAGETMTTAEMSAAHKHSISHRGKAFRAIRPAIAQHVVG